MKKKDILKEFERRYSSFFSQIPISQPLKFISDAIDEAEKRTKKDIIEKLEKMKPDDVYDGAVVIRTLNQAIKTIKQLK